MKLIVLLFSFITQIFRQLFLFNRSSVFRVSCALVTVAASPILQCALLKPCFCFGVLFLVVFIVCFAWLLVDCFEQKNRCSKLEDHEFQVSKSRRAVIVAFRWKKASVPNQPSTYALLQEYYELIGTWGTTLKNSTTTRIVWLWSWLINQRLQFEVVLPKGQEGWQQMGYNPVLLGSGLC